MFEPFPFFNKNDLSVGNGSFIKAPKIYSELFQGKAKIFFKDISTKQGWFICPNGFSCFADEKRVFFGIRVMGRFDRARNKYKLTVGEFNPVLFEKDFFDLLGNFIKINNLFEEVDFNNQTIHEIRTLNKTIKSNSEQAQEKITRAEGVSDIEEHVKRIFAASSLITTRLNIVDLSQNPELLGAKSDVVIHNKFFKAARCLESSEKRIAITCRGESHKTINCYSHFEILPVVLLENAVKYSPPDQVVDVSFFEKDENLLVTIQSVGPLVLPDEEEKIFEKGFRGRNAISSVVKGSGIGLYFARLICEQHGISISAASSTSSGFRFNSIEYAAFTISLQFPLHRQLPNGYDGNI